VALSLLRMVSNNIGQVVVLVVVVVEVLVVSISSSSRGRTTWRSRY